MNSSEWLYRERSEALLLLPSYCSKERQATEHSTGCGKHTQQTSRLAQEEIAIEELVHWTLKLRWTVFVAYLQGYYDMLLHN